MENNIWNCPVCGMTGNQDYVCLGCGIFSPLKRFSEKTFSNGTKVIFDNINKYEINYSDDDGYIAYNNMGQEVYHIYPDQKVSFTLEDGSKIIASHSNLSIYNIDEYQKIDADDGIGYSICNGKIFEKYYYNVDGSIKEHYYYKSDGNLREKTVYSSDGYIKYLENGSMLSFDKEGRLYQEEYTDGRIKKIRDDGIADFFTNDGKKYLSVYPSGQYAEYYDDNIKYYTKKNELYRIEYSNGEINYCQENLTLFPDGTFKKNSTEESGKYSWDDEENLVCENDDGSIDIYGGESYKKIKKISADGKVYEYDNDRDLQKTIINGKEEYSRINHIEYDEAAYNNILTTLNSIGEANISSISSACSDIESSINSFPDRYSGNGIGSVESNIKGHIDLIGSLSKATNYSLMAYQICDDNLKSGLYLLVDSLFEDTNSDLARDFKNNIKLFIEDRDNDGILEYKNNTNFAHLSDMAIVNSTFVDEDGNKWYLSKNNTVLGVEGNNIKINYGGEKFDLSYDENGIIILKDSQGKDVNIFGEYNIKSKQFGGSQNDLPFAYNNVYVNDVISKYFPDATKEETVALLDKACNVGCGYTALANYVFKQFEGKEENFYNTFGFPQYNLKKTEDGFKIDYNYEPLIMNLFCEKNSNSKMFDIEKTINRASGTSPNDVVMMTKYLKNNYGVKLNNIPEDLNFIADRGYSLYKMSGELYMEDGGDHAMIVVGTTDDQKLIVSSWGQKFIYEQSNIIDYDSYIID